MNKEREALTIAREVIEAGDYHYICDALHHVGRHFQRLEGACGDLRNVIQAGITLEDRDEPEYSLDCWCRQQGLELTRGQACLARLAWIDKLLEAYP